eukprot:TRINITY_DN69812_c0_g1_i1.p1 TRINITY_DN69812_c0_g1~~TRINITY_DN69812_c0_g1_i1.p1  ORF type:complete len:265 (-),score=24.77 TRINITY_DN69812_c0_g1_i1:98-892(-)
MSFFTSPILLRPPPMVKNVGWRYPGASRRSWNTRVHRALVHRDQTHSLTSHMLSQQWVPSSLAIPSFALVSLYMHDHFLNIGGSSRHRMTGHGSASDPLSLVEPRSPLFNGLPQLASLIPTNTTQMPFADWQQWTARLHFATKFRGGPGTTDPEPEEFAQSAASAPPVSGHLPAPAVPLEPVFLTSRLIFSRAHAAPLVTPRLGVLLAMCCNPLGMYREEDRSTAVSPDASPPPAPAGDTAGMDLASVAGDTVLEAVPTKVEDA